MKIKALSVPVHFIVVIIAMSVENVSCTGHNCLGLTDRCGCHDNFCYHIVDEFLLKIWATGRSYVRMLNLPCMIQVDTHGLGSN